ncbi:hypothetical protein EV175_000822 [Coemansia sp. RSA 1933]|nr:hypothetical protein EV175_000822 [Coemansia sp. RSA 1933]
MRTFTSAILPRKRRPAASRGADEDDQTGELRRFDTVGSTMVEEDPAERGRPAAGYAQRLSPSHVPFVGGQALPEDPWDISAPQEPSVASESVLERSTGGGLLKRVSSMPGNLSLFRAHLIDPLRHPEFYAAPRYTRNQPMHVPANDPDATPVFGYALLVLTVVLFVASIYPLAVSKFMPYAGVPFVDAVKDDRHFCLLMHITGLSFVFAVFLNWISMKFFRHNPTAQS